MKSSQCQDCGLHKFHHFQTWSEGLISGFLPWRLMKILPRKSEEIFNILLENFFVFSGLASLKDNFDYSDIQLRSACFIKEAEKQGIRFKALYGPFGYTNYFQAKSKDKIFRFDSLPVADFLNKYGSGFLDDKALAKKHLQKGNFPVAEGKSFWFWQKRKAVDYAVNKLGFPLVVKPRNGSLSRHVTTEIINIDDLKKAINLAINYSPSFIIEKFLAETFVFRATVIDFDFVACVKQIPANVKADGVHSIQELIDIKNKNPQRGEPHQKEFTLYRIAVDETTKNLLKEKGYNFSSIPEKGKTIYLQKNPFLKLGGDIIEITNSVHPDNLRLFKEIARFFDTRVVGIDFLVKDISVSWKKQLGAVLELNSAPCIELHHFPSIGKPQNVAAAMVNLFLKVYT